MSCTNCNHNNSNSSTQTDEIQSSLDVQCGCGANYPADQPDDTFVVSSTKCSCDSCRDKYVSSVNPFDKPNPNAECSCGTCKPIVIISSSICSCGSCGTSSSTPTPPANTCSCSCNSSTVQSKPVSSSVCSCGSCQQIHSSATSSSPINSCHCNSNVVVSSSHQSITVKPPKQEEEDTPTSNYCGCGGGCYMPPSQGSEDYFNCYSDEYRHEGCYEFLHKCSTNNIQNQHISSTSPDNLAYNDCGCGYDCNSALYQTSSTPASYNFEIRKGQSFDMDLDYKDATKHAVNLTGYTVKCFAKYNEKSFSIRANIIDAARGRINLALSSYETSRIYTLTNSYSDFTDYSYVIQLISPSKFVYTIMSGVIRVYPMIPSQNSYYGCGCNCNY